MHQSSSANGSTSPTTHDSKSSLLQNLDPNAGLWSNLAQHLPTLMNQTSFNYREAMLHNIYNVRSRENSTFEEGFDIDVDDDQHSDASGNTAYSDVNVEMTGKMEELYDHNVWHLSANKGDYHRLVRSFTRRLKLQ